MTSDDLETDDLLQAETWWERNRESMTATLMSVCVHGIILLILAVTVLPIQPVDLTKYIVVHTEVVQNAPLETVDNLEVTPTELTDSNFNDLASMTTPTRVLSKQPSPVTLDKMEADLEMQIEYEQFLGKVHRLGDMAGRSEAARTLMVHAQGGTAGSEAAVASGLDWLKRHQRPDGSWSFDHRHDGCNCSSPGNLGNATVGATAMALLCYLGAGNTHESGKYQEQVAKAIEFLKVQFDAAEEVGDMRQTNRGNAGMYTQGLVTIALCELHGMTRDRYIGKAAQKCVDYIMRTQNPQEGGWRYVPNADVGDTSVVGWQVMALTSARMARLRTSPKSFELARRFLNSVQMNNGAYYGYTGPEKKASTTAIGLLCRMYTGWGREQEPMRVGVSYLSSMGPSRDNAYYNYYATQVLHHWGGSAWQDWNAVMRPQLVKSQIQQGHAAGSWNPRDPHSNRGGRLYETCLNILTLEVYYRHLPIYQRRSVDVEF